MSASVRIRFRSDNWHYVSMRTNGADWVDYIGLPKEEYEALPLLQPGDIWRSHWRGEAGNLAGYAICCPTCKEVHPWTTATNCSFNLTEHTYKDKDGNDKSYKVCGHSGIGSCWDWTGSAEEGTLSANPSLLCHTCGYHGWLKNGELTAC